MSEDDRKRGRSALDEIDVRLEGLLGKLGGTLGDLLDKLQTGDSGEVHRSYEFQSPRGPVRAETGVRIRMGLAEARSGSRAPGTPPGPRRGYAAPGSRPSSGTAGPADGDAPRRPHMESHVAGARWIVTAELPGVAEADLDVAVTGRTLVVRTTGRRRYLAESALPDAADPADMVTHLHNGILEISMAHAGEER